MLNKNYYSNEHNLMFLNTISSTSKKRMWTNLSVSRLQNQLQKWLVISYREIRSIWFTVKTGTNTFETGKKRQ